MAKVFTVKKRVGHIRTLKEVSVGHHIPACKTSIAQTIISIFKNFDLSLELCKVLFNFLSRTSSKSIWNP